MKTLKNIHRNELSKHIYWANNITQTQCMTIVNNETEKRHQLCSRKCAKRKIFDFFPPFIFPLILLFLNVYLYLYIFIFSMNNYIYKAKTLFFFHRQHHPTVFFMMFFVLTINLQGCLSLLSTA